MRILSGICIVLLSGLALLYQFGNKHPIELRQTANAVCSTCRGSGNVVSETMCERCQGSGVHTWVLGGKTKPSAPCTACKGTGKVNVKVKCPACNGIVQSASEDIQLFIGHSPWERFLITLHIPVNENPAPQRDATGNYPLVIKYLSTRPYWRDVQVDGNKSSMEFLNNKWILSVDVFRMSEGIKVSKTAEFVVENRVLLYARAQ